jgi:flagellar biosynthesis protein FlhA
MAGTQAEKNPWAERMGSLAEIQIAAAVMAIIFVILVPLPPALMDALLLLNLTGSLVILMTTTYAVRPVDLSVFPSLLLVVTFFRLALNVATTRLILGGAAERGLSAAGNVVQAFANFVAGTNVVVGLVIFGILVIVQFVVITKGTTRISEVAARFTLDAMPGKQLSIDGDFSAGLISDDEARRRRRELSLEADFFGAMDGASKFVRGEAIASLAITLINLIGGFLIGTLHYSMSLGKAAGVFSRLTVGDGLVNQVPALMVSVATALLITKGSGGEGLGRDLGRQLFRNHRVFFIAAVFLILLAPSGLPVSALCLGALASFILGIFLRDREAKKTAAAPEEVPSGAAAGTEESGQEKARSLLVLEPIELELGYRLVALVDETQGGDLMSRLSRVRQRMARELGLVVPPVKVTDNTRLQPGEYCVKLRGNRLGHWQLRPGKAFVITEGEALDALGGLPGVDPSTGKPGQWMNESQAAAAARAGYLIRRIPDIVTDHLGKLIGSHAAEILTREEVSRLVTDLKRRTPTLVEELIPGVVKLGDVHKVLQNLLREQVSIRNLELILETLADHAEQTRDSVELTEHVRHALSRSICASHALRDGTIHAVLLDPALEEFLQTSVEKMERGSRLAIEPEIVETLVKSVGEAITRLEDLRLPPLLVCSGMIRAHLWGLLARKLPSVAVLAYEEVTEDFRLEVHGSVALEKVC